MHDTQLRIRARPVDDTILETPQNGVVLWFHNLLMVRQHERVFDFLAEDTEFCLRAAEKGFPSYLDCSIRVGHTIRPVLWPHSDGDVWIQWAGSPYRAPLADIA